MSAPFVTAAGSAPALALAFAIGVGFGAALERAGLGSAPRLVGQFYGRDLTVFKVMFSAVVVAMLGAFWLGRAGVLDLAQVYVPGTWVGPQLVGGLVFGGGLVLAGLCPGTACVAAASGRGDGFAVVGGVFAGVLATGLGFERIAGFHASGARGPLTLPEWLGVPEGVVVLALVLLALAGFAVAERIEGRA
jgi:uncharacterized membrane protein YedE/YeeE